MTDKKTPKPKTPGKMRRALMWIVMIAITIGVIHSLPTGTKDLLDVSGKGTLKAEPEEKTLVDQAVLSSRTVSLKNKFPEDSDRIESIAQQAVLAKRRFIATIGKDDIVNTEMGMKYRDTVMCSKALYDEDGVEMIRQVSSLTPDSDPTWQVKLRDLLQSLSEPQKGVSEWKTECVNKF